jgi:hypothetical protein
MASRENKRKCELLQTLDPAQYARVRPLLDDLMRFNNSIAGVLTRNNPGTVDVDHPGTPQVVLLMGPEGAYLAGAAPSAAQISALKNHVADLCFR